MQKISPPPTGKPTRKALAAAHAARPAQVIEELRPGQSIELLKELHILTREGKLNQDTRRKLKQVYHLYQFIEPLLDEVCARQQGFTLADHGAGKSYLGFILYDLFFNVAHAGKPPAGHIYGIETRAELVEKSRALAARLGFANMSFLNLSVQQATASGELPATVDIVTALHACDTATDDAIAFGLAQQARHMVLVPCCQAEVAGVLKKSRALNLNKTPAGRALAPPAAHPRVRQPDHQRAALPAARSQRLPGHRDRAGGLGAFDEKRTDPGQPPGAAPSPPRRAPRKRACSRCWRSWGSMR